MSIYRDADAYDHGDPKSADYLADLEDRADAAREVGR